MNKYCFFKLSCLLMVTTVGISVSENLLRAQTSDEEAINRSAERLLRSAAEAQQRADGKATLQACLEVAELLPKNSRVQQRAAELLYLSGHVQQSLPLFDRAIELEPARAAHNWQRGIALATAGDFKAGAEQFKLHHEVNPDDVENSAWYFLCVAKTSGIESAKKSIIDSRGDPREPMMAILRMLRGDLQVADVEKAAISASRGGNSDRGNLAKFYGDLYIALYYDSMGRSDDAVRYLQRSLSYKTAGYMTDTARVYLATRFPEAKNTDSNGQR